MLRYAAAFVAVLSLIACLIYPTLFFLGSIEGDLMKTVFLVASVIWFITASIWFREREPNEPEF